MTLSNHSCFSKLLTGVHLFTSGYFEAHHSRFGLRNFELEFDRLRLLQQSEVDVNNRREGHLLCLQSLQRLRVSTMK